MKKLNSVPTYTFWYYVAFNVHIKIQCPTIDIDVLIDRSRTNRVRTQNNISPATYGSRFDLRVEILCGTSLGQNGKKNNEEQAEFFLSLVKGVPSQDRHFFQEKALPSRKRRNIEGPYIYILFFPAPLCSIANHSFEKLKAHFMYSASLCDSPCYVPMRSFKS